MTWRPPSLTPEQIAAIPRCFGQKLSFLNSRPGPSDEWRLLEDIEAVKGNTLNPAALWEAGVAPEFIHAWLGGIEIPGLKPSLLPFSVPDYPKFQLYAEEAAREVDRLRARHKIMRYDPRLHPPPEDLDIAPGNLIIRKDRNRHVTD